MANSRFKIGKLVRAAVNRQPLNKAFLSDLMAVIELADMNESRKPSRYYKPSSMVCLRQMFFTRVGEIADDVRVEYNVIGMADTGSRRHTAIQEALMKMSGFGYDWKYLDVEEYLKKKWASGKCLDIQIKGKRGAETHLFHKTLLISFMCDGIIEQLSTGAHFLFEFKNQISFKYNGKDFVDEEHIDQVSCYGMCLDLDYALVLYENRDSCALECPEVFKITAKLKQQIIDKLLECESYVERLVPPPKYIDTKPCRWCKYKTACAKVGN